MIEEFREWSNYWGGIVGVVGFVLTLAGLCATFVGVWRSKSAAEQARDSADQAVAAIQHYDAIADLAAAMGVLDELKRLHREGVWHLLPDRYSILRQKLNRIRSNSASVTDTERTKIREAQEKLAQIEQRIERALAENGPPPNAAKLNQIVSAQVDSLDLILLRLQKQLRG